MELAAEDLAQLSRQVPGGDMITLSHWRRAIQVAGYISKANDIYAYVSPILNPLSGLARLGTRELIIKPAWKDMQQNVLRWFYQAYVNRVGVHLIELMSGRLAIGAEQYRRLTRRSSLTAVLGQAEGEPLVADIVGARGSGKSRLVESMRQVLSGDPGLIKARFEGRGLDPTLIEPAPERTMGRDPRIRAERRKRVPPRSLGPPGGRRRGGRLRHAHPGDRWGKACSRLTSPSPRPGTAISSSIRTARRRRPWSSSPASTGPSSGRSGRRPYDWSAGKGPREETVRSLIESLRATLPPSFANYTAAGLPGETPFGVAELVLPELAAQLHRAERAALLRQLHAFSGRSKVGRVMTQLGQHGRQVWTQPQGPAQGTQRKP